MVSLMVRWRDETHPCMWWLGLEPTHMEELLIISDGLMDLEGSLVWLGVHVDHGCV